MADTDTAPPPPTRLVLIRHGESEATVHRVIGGPRTCSGLSELGRHQADRLRQRLETTGEIAADVLIASAYPRAIQTAEIITASLGLEVRVESGFGEHDPGPDCDGLGFGEFVERYGMPDWESDLDSVTFPGGETVRQFHDRVAGALDRVLAEHAGEVIVIVCHGGVVDVFFRTLLGLVPTGGFELHTLNTSLTEFVQTRRPDRWRLARYNDSAHLAGLLTETQRQPVASRSEGGAGA